MRRSWSLLPSSRPAAGGSLRLLLVLFFVSGACGLVYEVAWMRMLTLVFGATAVATSAILSSFFAGMALGAFHFGRMVDRGRRPLVVYGLLELGIAASALLMPLALAGLTDLYVQLHHHLPLGYHATTAVRFVLSFVVLLVPATFMGGTLPVMVKHFTRTGGRLGWNVGALYATNTFGAVLGCIAAGFLLILVLGVRQSTYLAAALNVVVGGTALLLARGVPRGGRQESSQGETRVGTVENGGPAGADPGPPPPDYHPASPGLARLALWAAGLAGVSALALEVLWTRELVFFFDNSTHAFSTMLATFLFGIALGSRLVAGLVDRGRRLVAWLGVTEVFIGVFAVLAIPLLGAVRPVLEDLADQPLDAMLYWKWTGMRFVGSAGVMLGPTLLMGMAFPLATRIHARHASRIGSALGRVYAVNTLGGVVGSIVAGFVLVPWIGIRSGIVVVAALSVLVGVVLLLAEPSWRGRRVPQLAVLAGAATFLAVTGPLVGDAPPLTSFIERIESREVLSYEEGVGATVKVFQDDAGDRFISIDGFPVAGTSLGMRDAQVSLGVFPLLLGGTGPGARVNLIGFGAGGASWGVLQHDIEGVDCVELVPAVPRAAGWFPEINHGVLADPRFNLVRGDGRNYALVTDRTYRAISIDATSPKMAGNGSLYTLDFYELVKARLEPGGVVAQWLPFHLLSNAEIRMTARTFMDVFPHTTLWLSPLRHHGILVGSLEPLRIDVGTVRAKMAREGVRRELEPLRVYEPMDVLGLFLMGEGTLRRYVEGARVNTDEHPYLEFTPAMAYFTSKRYVVANLWSFLRRRESVLPLVERGGRSEEAWSDLSRRIQRRFEATQNSLAGDIFYHTGQEERARAAYLQALSIDPDEKNWAHVAWAGVRPGG